MGLLIPITTDCGELQTILIDSLPVLGARSLKARCQQDQAPHRQALGERRSQLFQFLGLKVFLGLWPCLPSLSLLLTWPPPLCVSPLLLKTPIILHKAHLIHCNLI